MTKFTWPTKASFRKERGRQKTLPGLFRCYPFNFTEKGEQKNSPGLTKSSYETWMKNFGDVAVLKTQGQESENSVELSPETAYEQVMTTLRSSDISASREISEMKVQLETKEEQLKHWKTEANKYKSDLDAANQLNGEYKSEIESYKRSMMALRKEHKKIEERLKAEQETRQKAEQRIVDIWEQLQQTIGCSEAR
jgi:chromosome segregation ATPase